MQEFLLTSHSKTHTDWALDQTHVSCEQVLFLDHPTLILNTFAWGISPLIELGGAGWMEAVLNQSGIYQSIRTAPVFLDFKGK